MLALKDQGEWPIDDFSISLCSLIYVIFVFVWALSPQPVDEDALVDLTCAQVLLTVFCRKIVSRKSMSLFYFGLLYLTLVLFYSHLLHLWCHILTAPVCISEFPSIVDCESKLIIADVNLVLLFAKLLLEVLISVMTLKF